MPGMRPFWRQVEDVGCLIEINHTPERFGAHVHLDGDPVIAPGDRVCVYGDPIDQFEITELFEVSFTTQTLGGTRP